MRSPADGMVEGGWLLGGVGEGQGGTGRGIRSRSSPNSLFAELPIRWKQEERNDVARAKEDRTAFCRLAGCPGEGVEHAEQRGMEGASEHGAE